MLLLFGFMFLCFCEVVRVFKDLRDFKDFMRIGSPPLWRGWGWGFFYYLSSFIDSTIGLRSESHAGMSAERMLSTTHTRKAVQASYRIG